MKVLVVYATKYGCTEKAAKKLVEHLGQDVKLVNLKKGSVKGLNLSDYDAIAIGGSIYVGKIQNEVKQFCSDNSDIIMKKKLGLFICCGFVDQVNQQFESSFGKKLLNHATVKEHFGYEYDFSKMNFMSKMAVKVMSKTKESKSAIKVNNIKKFADKLMGGLNQ